MKKKDHAAEKEQRVTVPVKFDEAMRRAVSVRPPKGGTNQDYVKANRARERRAKD